ncbi:MAG: 4-(cytidine 5'-diphospho)-2-C-methyl-D-erythritol kinase [Arcanobacterium sp.]|nr:4-(cytidine 5'-diphospho)-2-C-methyl-D-erythritol kinase [Arcanobacterium sp.]
MKQEVMACAPGKVNLSLRVGGLREDGFHELDTVFCALDIYDDVHATLDPALSMSITGLGEELPVDESNLVIKAAKLLQEKSGINLGARLVVEKRIPVAGGMAGGSADAAATLVALNELWELGYTKLELLEFGAELGSDVPFALLGGIAHGRGRGENLVPIETAANMFGVVMLANPVGLSTPAVFQEFDRLQIAEAGSAPAESTELISYLQEEADLSQRSAVTSAGLRKFLINDLEPAAFSLRPDLAEISRKLQEELNLPALLSGSGPTFAVLSEVSSLNEDVASLQKSFPELMVFAGAMTNCGAHLRWTK